MILLRPTPSLLPILLPSPGAIEYSTMPLTPASASIASTFLKIVEPTGVSCERNERMGIIFDIIIPATSFAEEELHPGEVEITAFLPRLQRWEIAGRYIYSAADLAESSGIKFMRRALRRFSGGCWLIEGRSSGLIIRPGNTPRVGTGRAGCPRGTRNVRERIYGIRGLVGDYAKIIQRLFVPAKATRVSD